MAISAAEQHVIDHFQHVHEAFRTADIEKLEDWTQLSPFPHGLDGWLNGHWLSHAISAGNLAAVSWVISKGVNVTYVDDLGFTALHSALQEERDLTLVDQAITEDDATQQTLELIDMLVEAGADVNLAGPMGDTALHFAAIHSSIPVLKRLIAHGADPFVRNDEYSADRPVDCARRAKRLDVAEYLRGVMKELRPDTPE